MSMMTQERIPRRGIVSLWLLPTATGKKSKRYYAICVSVGLALGGSGCASPPIKSPDGTRTVTFKAGFSKASIIENGQVLSKHAEISAAQFSPDSKHLAYAVKDSVAVVLDRSYVILDGKPQEFYSQIAVCSLAFSPDSRHLAYVASRKGEWLLVVDGIEQSGLFDATAPPAAFRWVGNAFSHPPGGPALLICDNPMHLHDKERPLRQSRNKKKLSSFEDELELNPGHHVIPVFFTGLVGGSVSESDTVELEFDARAGHVYLVSYQLTPRDLISNMLAPENLLAFSPISKTVGKAQFMILDMTEFLSRTIRYPPAQR